MTNKTQELNEAIAKFDSQKLNEISLTFQEQDLISSAAQKYAALMPLLEKLCNEPQWVNTEYLTTQIKEIINAD